MHNDTLCGMILKRVTSKKIFKKWNRCVCGAKPSFLQLYRTPVEWKQQGPIYWQTNIHSYMVTKGKWLKSSTPRRLCASPTTTSWYTLLSCWRTRGQTST